MSLAPLYSLPLYARPDSWQGSAVALVGDARASATATAPAPVIVNLAVTNTCAIFARAADTTLFDRDADITEFSRSPTCS